MRVLGTDRGNIILGDHVYYRNTQYSHETLLHSAPPILPRRPKEKCDCSTGELTPRRNVCSWTANSAASLTSRFRARRVSRHKRHIWFLLKCARSIPSSPERRIFTQRSHNFEVKYGKAVPVQPLRYMNGGTAPLTLAISTKWWRTVNLMLQTLHFRQRFFH